MNNIWSTYIQGIKTLYHSRLLRFSDVYKEQFMNAFGLGDSKSILEIGCGPGALCRSLKRWYPSSEIIGIDPDSAFIEFAKNNVCGASFLDGDAKALCFPDESFDVTVSNTVAEHIEPSKFFGEQYRVLKKGGVCLVLSTRHSISRAAACVSELSEAEKALWERVGLIRETEGKLLEVGGYPMTEQEYPTAMEKYGFVNVSTAYVTINLTPDNPDISRETAIEMFNANRFSELESARALKGSDVCELTRLINERYDRRIALYDAGEKQWDTDITTIMIIRGVKG